MISAQARSGAPARHPRRILAQPASTARPRIRLGLVLACALLGAPLASRAEDASGGDPLPPLSRQQVERIVRDYLLREPEVVVQAAQEHERRRREQAAVDARKAVIASRAALADPAAPSIGAPTPKVTLVEFFDYKCVYCRRMLPIVEQVAKENPDVRVVFKDLPILGPDSVAAARVALAARRQSPDRYHDLHQALMRSSDLSEARVVGIAGGLGLDTDQLRRDMAGAEVKAELDANAALAKSLGIAGTPAFVLGDALIPSGLSKADLTSRIAEVRKSCPAGC